MSDTDTVKYELLCDYITTGIGYYGVFWAKFVDPSNISNVVVEAPISHPLDYKPDEIYEFEIPKRFLNEAVVQLADTRINDPYKSLSSIYGCTDGVICRLIHEHAKNELKDKLKTHNSVSIDPYYDIDELKEQYLNV